MKTKTEYERFDAFAQKIISVPKKVIDRRAAAYKKEREVIKKAKA
jgi:hypothetical protein